VELTHSFTVPAPLEDAWATFMDLERVGGCFPGATVTDVTEEGFTGTVKVKLGPIALQYAGSGSFVERDDASHRAVIGAKGKDKRGNGTAGATVTIQLADDGAGSTRADVVTDLAVTGKPAQFGRGVMQDVSDKLLRQFIDCIEASIAPTPSPSHANAELATPAPSPSHANAELATPAPSLSHANAELATPARHVGPGADRQAPARHTPGRHDDALDLGSTVLPVLVRNYAKPVAAVVAVGVVAVLVRRALR